MVVPGTWVAVLISIFGVSLSISRSLFLSGDDRGMIGDDDTFSCGRFLGKKQQYNIHNNKRRKSAREIMKVHFAVNIKETTRRVKRIRLPKRVAQTNHHHKSFDHQSWWSLAGSLDQSISLLLAFSKYSYLFICLVEEGIRSQKRK